MPSMRHATSHFIPLTMIYHTPEIITEHYGAPINTYRDVKGRIGQVHRTKGYIIMVQFLDGISHAEAYAKEDGATLAQEEIDAILSANAYGEEWQRLPQQLKASDGSPFQGWVILRTGTLAGRGPTRINNLHFQDAISISTHAYVQHNKALDYN